MDFVLAFAWLMTQVLKKLSVTTPSLFTIFIVTASINFLEIELVNPPWLIISIAMTIFKWLAIDILKQGLLILSKTIASAIHPNVLGVIVAMVGAYITYLTIDIPFIRYPTRIYAWRTSSNANGCIRNRC